MKRGTLLAFVSVLLVLASISYAAECDYDPVCTPNIRSCGCGGTQTRYTLCEGGCSDWYPCSVSDIETGCDDSIDNDCDALIDCDDPDCGENNFCIDDDDDGSPLSTDCDDSNNDIYPGAEELCNLVDDNCDGTVDEGCDCTPAGSTKSCGTDAGECTIGTQTCQPGGTWGACDGTNPQTEICDTLDNNCDGNTDEGCDCINEDTEDCGIDTGACELGTRSCIDGVWSTCIGGRTPVEEICDNDIDDNCNGETDEICPVETEETGPEEIPTPGPIPEPTPEPELEVATRECIDLDGDTYGTNCPKGFDCDDEDAAVNPGASEICNNIDDNCNNIIDEYLTRECGISEIGVCTLGTERCMNSEWTGCTAVLPSEDICGNNFDDDCDGETDEGCDQISEQELALKQFLDIKLGRDKYDWDHYLDNYQKTKNFIDIRKSSTIAAGKTMIKIEIIPIQTLYNLTIFEYVPKFMAHSADDIIFSTTPEIIQADPLFAWHFDELSEKADLSYEVQAEIEGASEKTSTIAFAEGTAQIKRPWYFNILPLLVIPLLGFIFIFLVQLIHKKKK